VTLTNETFTTSQIGFDQLFAMNRFRAIENRLPLVRAATTSVSAVVGTDGRVLAKRRDGPGVLVADLPRAGGPTFYTAFGDWFVPLLAAMAAGAWAVRPRR
jgi:apolipoprotein N-acyltransferase